MTRLIWDVNVQVVTPLHVGNGEKWLPGFDFVVEGGGQDRSVLLLDVGRVLDSDEPLDPVAASRGRVADALPAERRSQYKLMEPFPVSGNDNVNQINSMVRDAHRLPYLPGSSLKGAIRTQLLKALAQPSSLDSAVKGLQESPKRLKWAGQSLEQTTFGVPFSEGTFPNRDMNRLLQVADMLPAGRPPTTAVCKISAYRVHNMDLPDIPIWCEAVMPGHRFDFRGRVAVDTESPLWPKLEPRQRTALEGLPETIRAQSEMLARKELDRWASVAKPGSPAQGVHDIYAGIIQNVAGAIPPVVPLQVGWGGGWTAKTVATLLSAEQAGAIGNIVRSSRRSFTNHASFSPGQSGPAAFPSTRRLASLDGQLWPPGWVYLTMTPVPGRK